MEYTNPAAMSLRRFGRRLGILPPLVRAFRRFSGASYERRFDDALLGRVVAGDTVWDVGANVGFYTERLSLAVGRTGRVVAFEPSPRNVATLLARFDGQVRANLEVVPAALSDTAGTVEFFENPAGDTTTDSLMARGAGAVRCEVECRRGDEYMLSHAPQVVKIDVEGFEAEVLRGMSQTLRQPTLRAVFVEIHFGILADRGLAAAPADIVRDLRAAGFSVSWIDPSHLMGLRRTGA